MVLFELEGFLCELVLVGRLLGPAVSAWTRTTAVPSQYYSSTVQVLYYVEALYYSSTISITAVVCLYFYSRTTVVLPCSTRTLEVCSGRRVTSMHCALVTLLSFDLWRNYRIKNVVRFEENSIFPLPECLEASGVKSVWGEVSQESPKNPETSKL